MAIFGRRNAIVVAHELLAPVLSTSSNKVRWYVGLQLNEVFGVCVALPFYNVLCVLTLVQLYNDGVDLIFTVEDRILRGTIRLLDYLVWMDFMCRSIGTRGSPSLTVTRIQVWICRPVLTERPLCIVKLVRSGRARFGHICFWLWGEWCRVRRYCVGEPFIAAVKVLVVSERALFKPNYHCNRLNWQPAASQWELLQLILGREHRRPLQFWSCLCFDRFRHVIIDIDVLQWFAICWVSLHLRWKSSHAVAAVGIQHKNDSLVCWWVYALIRTWGG